jgi:hypothetical protein
MSIFIKFINMIKFLKKIYFFNLFYLLIPFRYKSKISLLFNTKQSTFFIQNKLIFIHIPKTAGKSILYGVYGDKARQSHFLLKSYLFFFKNQINFFKFTVVRNPWDRMVSSFYYLKNKGGKNSQLDSEFYEKFIKDVPSFKEFIDKMISSSKYRENVLNCIHFIPQYNFIERNSNISVDFIIRYENLQSDFERLKKILFKKNHAIKFHLKKLPHLNKSAHKKYNLYYSESYMIDFVYQIYKEEIDFFNYTFS